MAKKGEPLDNDEVALAMQVLLEHWNNPEKVAVADVRRNLASAQRSKLVLKGRGGQPDHRTIATITIKTSDQIVDSVKGPPDQAVAYVLMVGISADLIDEAREKRDSRVVQPSAESGLIVPGTGGIN